MSARRLLWGCAAAGCVLLSVLAAAAGAEAEGGDSQVPEGYVDVAAPVWGAAPRWPFRGAVAYIGTDHALFPPTASAVPRSMDQMGVQYANADSGVVSHVLTSADDRLLCSGSALFVDETGVRWRYFLLELGFSPQFFVPWGDYAYPLYLSRDDDSRRSGLPWGLESAEVDPDGNDRHGEDNLWAEFAGSDGHYYVLAHQASDSICGPSTAAYVHDAASGEQVACIGYAGSAPRLVAPVGEVEARRHAPPKWGSAGLDCDQRGGPAVVGSVGSPRRRRGRQRVSAAEVWRVLLGAAATLLAAAVVGCSGPQRAAVPLPMSAPLSSMPVASAPVLAPPDVSAPSIGTDTPSVPSSAAPRPVDSVPQTTLSAPPADVPPKLVIDFDAVAPSWPFAGMVHLVAADDDRSLTYGLEGLVRPTRERGEGVWWLLYWPIGQLSPESVIAVPLAGLETECVGGLGLASLGPGGVEVGSVSSSVRVRWGSQPDEVAPPSQTLIHEIQNRPSNVGWTSAGDLVVLGDGAGAREVYEMRDPPRLDGEWWHAQARHEGPLLLVHMRPAHIECLNGVTWAVDAESGQVLQCGADTAATRFVAPDGYPQSDLVLPDPTDMGGVLDCPARFAARFDLLSLAWHHERLR